MAERVDMRGGDSSLLRLRDRFRGAMLGSLVGDALGMPLEGMAAETIRQRCARVTEMLPARMGQGTYTDDTEMMIGLAEALLAAAGRVDLDEIARRFGENYDPFRGYGQTTATILSTVRAGVPWSTREIAHRPLYQAGFRGVARALWRWPMRLPPVR
ncbi:MAG: ADP-ribosylglycohydrolase family protein [Planctomycetota bacterium]